MFNKGVNFLVKRILIVQRYFTIRQNVEFLGTFAKLRKATMNFIICVCPH